VKNYIIGFQTFFAETSFGGKSRRTFFVFDGKGLWWKLVSGNSPN